MNFNCIIKTGLVAVAAMVSLSSFSQVLIARQAPIDKKVKSVDSLALQKQIRTEQSEYPALSLYPNWNNQYVHACLLYTSFPYALKSGIGRTPCIRRPLLPVFSATGTD